MSARSVAALGGALLLGGVVAFALGAEPIPEVRTPAPVVFVCRNGVAMSVWSAAYFNRLASARGLRERAMSRAAVPSFSAVPLNMAFALAIDGFREQYVPSRTALKAGVEALVERLAAAGRLDSTAVPSGR